MPCIIYTFPQLKQQHLKQFTFLRWLQRQPHIECTAVIKLEAEWTMLLLCCGSLSIHQWRCKPVPLESSNLLRLNLNFMINFIINQVKHWPINNQNMDFIILTDEIRWHMLCGYRKPFQQECYIKLIGIFIFM